MKPIQGQDNEDEEGDNKMHMEGEVNDDDIREQREADALAAA